LPFLAGAARRHALRLQDQRVYPKSGIVMLNYAVGG